MYNADAVRNTYGACQKVSHKKFAIFFKKHFKVSRKIFHTD